MTNPERASAVVADGDVATLRMGEVVAGFSRALDLAEGEAAGHAIRTCMIGMRLAREIYLLPQQRAGLFYALLLKDLGCTSNAAKFCGWLGSDEREAKRDWRTANFRGVCGRVGYLLRRVKPGQTLAARVAQFMRAARASAAAARDVMEMRSDGGVQAARTMGMAPETEGAIRHADEQWDGQGNPRGLAGEEIPMLARIVSLAQSMEVFYRRDGLSGAMLMAKGRSGTSFDPDLVHAMLSLRKDGAFWERLHRSDLANAVLDFEPPLPNEGVWCATEDDLDRVAETMGRVADLKSAWTIRHSVGVAEVAVGIAETMGMNGHDLRMLRRAALLHDVGKLGISNLILDKPGKLAAAEMAEMRKHAFYSRQLLESVKGFEGIAGISAGHHERMDGRGYDRGVEAQALCVNTRILAVADMFEALAARRPYREDLTGEEVLRVLDRNVGAALDGQCVEGLKGFLRDTQYEVEPIAA